MHKLYEHVAVVLSRAFAVSREHLRREDGQGAVEYALAVLVVAGVIAIALAGFTDQIEAFMDAAGAALLLLVP